MDLAEKLLKAMEAKRKERYRWTVVSNVRGWFHVEDLKRWHDTPGAVIRYLPPLSLRTPWSNNGGW